MFLKTCLVRLCCRKTTPKHGISTNGNKELLITCLYKKISPETDTWTERNGLITLKKDKQIGNIAKWKHGSVRLLLHFLSDVLLCLVPDKKLK